MTNYPLTLEEFRDWLKSKNPEEIVGWQGGCHCCPVFKCLKDKGKEVYSVNYETTFFLYRSDFLLNPEWVKSFINKVDDSSIIPLKQGEMNASITAQQALKVLEGIL